MDGHIESGNIVNSRPVETVDISSVVDWGFRLVSMVILPLVLWMITMLISIDKRVAIMEGNRLTATDGMELRVDISTIQKDLLKGERRIGTLEECQIKIRVGDQKNC